MNKYIDLGARFALSFMFFMAGWSKIGSYAGTQGYMESQGVPGMLLPAVIALEIIAPLMLVVGWQTRWAAMALAGFCVISALLFHLNFSDQIQSIMFMKNITIAGGFALLFVHGAGELSLDHKLSAS